MLVRLLVLFAACAASVFGADRQASACEVKVNTVVVLDGAGKPMWSHEFPHEVGLNIPWYEGVLNRRCVFVDLNGDGKRDVVFTVVPREHTRVGTELLAFNHRGKQLPFRFKPQATLYGPASDDVYPGPTWINNVHVIPGRPLRIAVSSNDHEYAPNQIVVLDANLNVESEYWHPGHLLEMSHGDIDGDGRAELLVAGVNNGEHAATLLVFDPASVNGTARGLSDPRFGLLFELGSDGRTKIPLSLGTEKSVVIFPRSCVATKGPKPMPYNRVFQLRITSSQIVVIVSAGEAAGDVRAVHYTLNHRLEVDGVGPTKEFHHAFEEARRAGYINHDWEEELFELRRNVRVIRRP